MEFGNGIQLVNSSIRKCCTCLSLCLVSFFAVSFDALPATSLYGILLAVCAVAAGSWEAFSLPILCSEGVSLDFFSVIFYFDRFFIFILCAI